VQIYRKLFDVYLQAFIFAKQPKNVGTREYLNKMVIELMLTQFRSAAF